MTRISDIEDSRRKFLLYLLSTGALAALPGCASNDSTSLPSVITGSRSIYQLGGDVRINGQTANPSTLINLGDVIETFDKSYVIFVVNKDSFILRSSRKMTLPNKQTPAAPVSTAFALERGKVLSVLASRRTDITTPNAVIGVRGTGVYIEAEPEQSYVCVCYGTSDISAINNPALTETIVSEHHDAPRYIVSAKNTASRIVPATFKNHDDQELLLIETLVGRSPPYAVPAGVQRSRRGYF